mmetsp:Transcript_20265/g.30716  ORF Transcript_20265/g.30716 Transcript_20265/m.30716 type:complete len:324 (-) Transcript_20265:223-1194(-)|eukprot:CAMPEP_0194209292 /NCGR_PEP_ID=MMETSP0156-20130528/7471_1 /TAXON_ID=33649 /ORGANISM="Thalassionema nitzschioides, Strain L26-B" /LENGTH=323 /DNA_ID=CAMNT_0038936441 /DNA_START=42 /DNA_END=1013 /DNA_ORIENTATION=-
MAEKVDLNSKKSVADGFRKKSGLDITFGTLMRLMHKGDHKQKMDASLSAETVQGILRHVELSFPGALPTNRMAKQAYSILEQYGYNNSGNTLVATALCCDELNRQLEGDICSKFGSVGAYNMGGLAGFCFGGVVGFGNMANHVPAGGNCLVVYGPHVGIDWDFQFGRVPRDESSSVSSECCGPAQMAYEYSLRVRKGERAPVERATDIIESQQTWVCQQVDAVSDRISAATNPQVELPYALYDAQSEILQRIVQKAGSEFVAGKTLAFLGGITINTPEGTPEYFLPKQFAILDASTGEMKHNLLDPLLAARPAVAVRRPRADK